MKVVPDFVERWRDGRCIIRVHGVDIKVSHVYLPARAKPYFAAYTRDGVEFYRPMSSFRALLRKLDALLRAVSPP